MCGFGQTSYMRLLGFYLYNAKFGTRILASTSLLLWCSKNLQRLILCHSLALKGCQWFLLAIILSGKGWIKNMPPHGTAHVIEIGSLQVPWSSMKIHGSDHVLEIGPLQVPWNTMELLMSSIHGIDLKGRAIILAPSFIWNRVTSCFTFLMTWEVSWGSMDLIISSQLPHTKFHGIPWNYWCNPNWETLSLK